MGLDGMSDEAVRDLLLRTRRIAVVGASDRPGRPSNGVFRFLLDRGYDAVPVNPARQETYENPAVTTPAERWAHFSAEDHVRIYGLDFADRLREAGFKVDTFRVSPEEEVRYGLLRTEWLYVGRKPDA